MNKAIKLVQQDSYAVSALASSEQRALTLNRLSVAVFEMEERNSLLTCPQVTASPVPFP